MSGKGESSESLKEYINSYIEHMPFSLSFIFINKNNNYNTYVYLILILYCNKNKYIHKFYYDIKKLIINDIKY